MLDWIYNQHASPRHRVLGLSVKHIGTSDHSVSDWDEPKPKLPKNFDKNLQSYASVLTICSELGKTFAVQLMAFDFFPSQLKQIFTDPTLTVFCHGWDHAYLMIQHLYGDQCDPELCSQWKVDRELFVAGLTKVIDLKLMFEKDLQTEAAWLLSVRGTDGKYCRVANFLEDLIRVTYGAKMLVHFQNGSRTFDVDFDEDLPRGSAFSLSDEMALGCMLEASFA